MLARRMLVSIALLCIFWSLLAEGQQVPVRATTAGSYYDWVYDVLLHPDGTWEPIYHGDGCYLRLLNPRISFHDSDVSFNDPSFDLDAHFTVFGEVLNGCSVDIVQLLGPLSIMGGFGDTRWSGDLVIHARIPAHSSGDIVLAHITEADASSAGYDWEKLILEWDNVPRKLAVDGEELGALFADGTRLDLTRSPLSVQSGSSRSVTIENGGRVTIMGDGTWERDASDPARLFTLLDGKVELFGESYATTDPTFPSPAHTVVSVDLRNDSGREIVEIRYNFIFMEITGTFDGGGSHRGERGHTVLSPYMQERTQELSVPPGASFELRTDGNEDGILPSYERITAALAWNLRLLVDIDKVVFADGEELAFPNNMFSQAVIPRLVVTE